MRSVVYVVVLLLANYCVIVAPAAVSPRVFSFAASPQAQRKKEGGLSRKEKSPWFGAGLLAVPAGGGPKAGSRGAKGDDHYSPRKAKGRTAQPAAQTRRFQLPDLIAMSAAMERFKDYMRDINPRKTFEMICKDGECRMVEIKTAWAKWNDMMKDVPPPPKDGKKRVLILMSDTGGGHRASAQALDRSLSEQFPGKINVTIMDIWTDHAQPPFNNFVPVYRYLAKNPLLWRGFYLWGLFPPSKMFTEIWSWQNSYKSFKKAIACSHPDLVVSVHPLCQLMPIWAVEEINKVRDKSKFPVNFVTVVTDLGGAHKTWFDRRADKVFIPSMAVKKVASANRIEPDKIVLRGLPIRPAFWKLSKPKSAMRRALGLEDKSKMVLVMGGGDGVGGLGKIVIEIADRLGKAKSMQGQKSQVVVICGNNKKLVQQLQAKKYHDSVRVVVKGFVDNVDEFMGASDCLVTKAGPGTIAEAMTRGLPLIISSFLPGQEAGNVPYVVNGGFGVYTGNRPRKIADMVCKYFSDDELLHTMSRKASNRSRPTATAEIAKDIGNIVLRTTLELPDLPPSATSDI